MLRDCRVALGVVGDWPQKAAHGPDVLAFGRFVRDGVSASGRLGHAEAVLLDLRLLQPGIAEGAFRVLKRLVVVGEIRPGGHLARASLPAVPPQSDQSHVVVARSGLARLRHQSFEILPRPDSLDRVPGRFPSLRAPQKPRRQRIGSEEEDVLGLQHSLAHAHVRKRVVVDLLHRADQERARTELLGARQGKGLRELPVRRRPFHVQQAAIADGHRAPAAIHRVQRGADERGIRPATRFLGGVPGQWTAADLSPPQPSNRCQVIEEVGAVRAPADEPLHQQSRPEGREAALGGSIGHRDAATRGRVRATDRPRVFVLGRGVPSLLAGERLDREERRADRVQSVDHRRFAGRVPMSRNWITCIGCALKTNPRAPSPAGIPSSLARPIMNGVRLLDISKSCLANLSGRPSSLAGSSMAFPAAEERWMLKTSAAPSSLPSEQSAFASGTGSPSVASPSVMLMTMGGNPFGCSATHFWTISAAILKAELIGVPPTCLGSNQSGNFTVCSTRPPAPSSAFLVRSSMRSGLLASSLIGIRSLPVSGPSNADFTTVSWPYPITPTWK